MTNAESAAGSVPSAAAFVVSLTPFTADGAIDEPAFRAHLQRMGRAGIGVYVAGSGSGEGYTLSRDERFRVLAIAAEELAGVVPVRAMGVEPRTAAEAIELVDDTVEAGLDATQIYSLDMGHGYKPRPEELELFLRTVLDATDTPVVLSTHQSVGYLYPIELLRSMTAEFSHVVGLNVTTSDLAYVADAVDLAAGRIDVHVGGPAHALAAWKLGATGYLSSEGNLAPQLCVALAEAVGVGALADAEAIHDTIMRIHRATQAAGGIVGAKAALRSFGIPGGWPRPPRLTSSDDVVDTLIAELSTSGVAEAEGLTFGGTEQ